MPSSSAAVRGSLLVLAGASLWGTTGTAQALAPAAATPIAIGTTRLLLGAVLLVGWALLRRRGSLALAPGRDLRALALPAIAGAVGVAAYQLSFFAAVDVAGVALGTAVAIGSSPISTGLIEWALDRRPPSARWWVATAVAAVGVALLAGPSQLVPAGVVLALLAGFSYAAYAVASKRLLDAGLGGPDAMAIIFGLGSLLLAPLVPGLDLSFLAEPAGIAVLGWLAAATVLLAYLLFAAGLRHVPASTAATLTLAEPLTAATLGIALLGERPTAVGLLGGAAILLGLVVVAVPARAPAWRPPGRPGTVPRHGDAEPPGPAPRARLRPGRDR